ncbi:UPF0149 family protein [Hydrogenophaga sp.]|uniref:UPF0149 family protein n=1 Tax=Hydrogenophaga sp. TaxID=1904254 RepID=UPI0035661D4F
MISDPPNKPMDNDDFDELDAILDDLRTRGDEVPQWEFCEGAMAALVCSRRVIMPSEYFPVLLGLEADAPADGAPAEPEEGMTRFADAIQAGRFMELWMRRWNEVAMALNAEVETLEDENCYHPEVMDVRGAVLELSDEARAEIGDQELPAFAQVWALGFMFVVENWAEEWAAPRDKEAAGWLNDALDAIVSLTDDDTDPPAFSMHSEDGPPSVSEARMNTFGGAIWAVYDLRELWRNLGPRIETVRKTETPGRNDPCWCGSGKKFKKCHGLH